MPKPQTKQTQAYADWKAQQSVAPSPATIKRVTAAYLGISDGWLPYDAKCIREGVFRGHQVRVYHSPYDLMGKRLVVYASPMPGADGKPGAELSAELDDMAAVDAWMRETLRNPCSG